MEAPHHRCKLHRIHNEVEEKHCWSCGIWKPLDQFYKAPLWDGLDRQCKGCRKQYNVDNKEKIRIQKQEYRERTKEHRKQWFQENKKVLYEKRRQRCLENPGLRASYNLRTRLCGFVRKGAKAGTSQDLLGCTVEFLRDHLQSKFQEGMTWDNYGEWHIDHIVPCSSFNLIDPIEQRICCHYSNLQPMWAAENVAKSDKVDQLDIDEIKHRLTPEIVERLKLRRAKEIEKNTEEENDKVLYQFRIFWRQVEHNDLTTEVTISTKEHIAAYMKKTYRTLKDSESIEKSEILQIARDDIRHSIVEKQCTKCKVTKPRDQFHKKSDARDGLQVYCKECINGVKRELRAKKRASQQ